MTLEQLRRTDKALGRLRTIARYIHRMDVAACNDPDAEARNHTRRGRLMIEVADLALELRGKKQGALRVYHQGDPRGCSLYLIDSSMDESNYNDGIALG